MELQGLTSPWPFIAWGIDIIKEIRSVASNRHRYIVLVVDYFSKWVEAESYTSVRSKQMARFIYRNIIYRYGLPHHVVTDNGVQFQSKTTTLIRHCKIEHHRSSPYHPQANGAVDAANKNIKRILAKMIENYRDWSEYL